MSPRARLVVMLGLTLLLLGGVLVYAVSQLHRWHNDGWTGVLFTPDIQQAPTATKSGPYGAQPGEVVMTYGGTDAEHRLQSGDRILSINGIPARDLKGLRALRETLEKGDVVTYRFERGGKTRDAQVRLVSPLRSGYLVIRTVVAFLVALTFIAIALLVLVRQPGDPRAVVFYAFAGISAFNILGTMATLVGQASAGGIVPSFGINVEGAFFISVICLAYPPLLLHLSLIFPKTRPVVERHPYVIRWVYAGALLATLLLSAGIFLMLNAVESSNIYASGYSTGRSAARGGVAIALSAGLLLALQVIFAGRKEGLLRAFRHRPFRAVFSIVTLLTSIAYLVGRMGLKKTAAVGMSGSLLLPILILGLYPILACVALYRSYKAANVEEKRQVQWPLWALLIAVLTRIVTITISGGAGLALSAMDMPITTGWRFFFQAIDIIPLAVSVVVPIAFGMAILKYRLMNIDLIIRKTVVYTILSGAIIVLYLILVGGLGTVLVNVAGLRNQTMVIASTLVVALLFVPLRNKLQTLVDRNLFRRRFDYPEALKVIAADAATTHDVGAFLASTAEKIQQAVQNRAVVIFIERHEELVATAKVGVSDHILGALRMRRIPELLDRPFDPRRRTLPDDVTAALKRVEASLVVPIGSRGFVALAPKLSEGELDVEDIDFLRSAADQLLLAIDRVRMHADEEDYAQARAIQQSLLPREMPRVAGVDVSGIWQPARTVGGDYYDLLKLSEHELAFCIGDVAGKGMPAALLMSALQAAVRASAMPGASPRDLCERVRRVIVSSLSGGRFVTFFYAILDTSAMRLRWCNAGHNAPILVRATGDVVRLTADGSALSRLFRDAPFEERSIDIQPGDRIVLFTDGASEASDDAGDIFGEQRLEELVIDSRDLRAAELQQNILDATLAFSRGELEDDLTLVVVAV